jgi:hypothetical protein
VWQLELLVKKGIAVRLELCDVHCAARGSGEAPARREQTVRVEHVHVP